MVLATQCCYKFLILCSSRLLRRWITQPLLEEEEIKERQDMVEEFMTSDAPVLVKLKSALYKLPDFERAITTIFHKKVKQQNEAEVGIIA